MACRFVSQDKFCIFTADLCTGDTYMKDLCTDYVEEYDPESPEVERDVKEDN